MIRLLTAEARTGLVVAAMAATVPMITFAQETARTNESISVAAKVPITDASPSVDKNSMENDQAVQIVPPVRSSVPARDEVEIQSRFNELRRELLDNRAPYIDRWLFVIGIALTFLGIVAVVGAT